MNRGAWQATVHRVKELDMTFFTFSSLKKKKKTLRKTKYVVFGIVHGVNTPHYV